MPWVTPATIHAIAINAPKLAAVAGGTAPASGAVAALLALAWIIRGRATPQLRFAVLFLCGTAAITLGHFWARIDLLPQPHRYHAAMDLAMWLAAAFLLDRVLITRPLKIAVLFIAIAVCAPILIHQRRIAHRLERPVDIRGTAPYQVSNWLAANMAGARVFATAPFDAWLDAFHDIPMINGGFANGIRNQVLWGVVYQTEVGDSPSVMLDWMKALGCDALAGDSSFFQHPEKLRGLQELWRDGSHAVYAVPRASRSLAHVLRAGDLPVLPLHYDTRPLHNYLAALDDPALPAAKFTRRGMSAATIDGDLQPEQVLSVQISWDEGWHARVNGQPRSIYADKLGQIVIEPQCNGPCTVDLRYDGGIEMRLVRIVSVTALAGCFFWIPAARRRQ